MPRYRDAHSWAELAEMVKPVNLRGWMTTEEYEYLFTVAKRLPPGARVLEVGVFGATTLILFALMSDATVTGIDSFENDTPCVSPLTGETIGVEQFARENIAALHLTERISIVHGRSQEIPGEVGWRDVIIIDGDHSYDGVTADLLRFAPWVTWVRAGGLLVLDDYYSTVSTRNAIDGWRWRTGGAWQNEWGFEQGGECNPETGEQRNKMIVLKRRSNEGATA